MLTCGECVLLCHEAADTVYVWQAHLSNWIELCEPGWLLTELLPQASPRVLDGHLFQLETDALLCQGNPRPLSKGAEPAKHHSIRPKGVVQVKSWTFSTSSATLPQAPTCSTSSLKASPVRCSGPSAELSRARHLETEVVLARTQECT